MEREYIPDPNARLREDIERRPAGCLCTWEYGDSECPVHPTCPECGCVECDCADAAGGAR